MRLKGSQYLIHAVLLLFAHVSPQDAIKYCNRSASQRFFDVTLVDVFPYFKGAQ